MIVDLVTVVGIFCADSGYTTLLFHMYSFKMVYMYLGDTYFIIYSQYARKIYVLRYFIMFWGWDSICICTARNVFNALESEEVSSDIYIYIYLYLYRYNYILRVDYIETHHINQIMLL